MNQTTTNTNQSKAKFVAKGHDAILKNAQDAGSNIEIVTMSGEVIIGKLLNRDKFTVTLMGDDGRKLTVYKHGIESFAVGKALN